MIRERVRYDHKINPSDIKWSCIFGIVNSVFYVLSLKAVAFSINYKQHVVLKSITVA